MFHGPLHPGAANSEGTDVELMQCTTVTVSITDTLCAHACEGVHPAPPACRVPTITSRISHQTSAQELLRQCAAADQRGAQLLASRDAAVQGAVAALQEYTAALTLLLPPDYSQESNHSQWSAALEAALDDLSPTVRAHIMY